MRDLIDKIDSPDGAFHDGNPASGEAGTIVTAKWLNAVQDSTRSVQAEILSVLAANEIAPDSEKADQLLKAFGKMLGKKADAAGVQTAFTVGQATKPTDAVQMQQMQAALSGIGSCAAPTSLLAPSNDGGWRDVYRAGWLPGWFNQQWGGAQAGMELIDSTTGQLYRFDAATGNVQDDAAHAIGSDVVCGDYAQPVVLSETGSYDKVFFKLYKAGNPTDSVTLSIYSDNNGIPGALLATSQSIPCKLLTSNNVGEWYLFTFNAPIELGAGTKYQFVLSRSGAINGSNCPCVKATNASRYPFGVATRKNNGVFTTNGLAATACACFMLPNIKRFLTAGGMFDQKLTFTQGTPVNQSKLLCQPARGYFDGKSGTILYRGAVQVNGTLYDVGAGIDHDRLVLGTSAQGYPTVTLYRADRTSANVTGTASIAAGAHDVAVSYRCVGDGADYLRLYVDGVTVGQPLTAQTFSMSEGWRDQATSWLGGGLPLVPAWDAASLHSFAALPSAVGWTWAGSASEANAVSVSGGSLYQNRGGYGSGDTGYYTRQNAGLTNATGWAVVWRGHVAIGDNSAIRGVGQISVSDGAKTISLDLQEYFFSVDNGSGTRVYIQCDMHQDNTLALVGRGSDYYVLLNNRLVIDGTGQMTAASAANQIIFGDTTTQAGTNGDVVTRYLRICSSGPLLPAAAQGATLSEFAYWSGDQSSILPGLAGDGSPRSVRKLCGLNHGYIDGRDAGVFRDFRRGVAISPTTASTSPVLLMDMESFVIGSSFDVDFRDVQTNSGQGNQTNSTVMLDGISGPSTYFNTNLGNWSPVFAKGVFRTTLGLHRVDVRWAVGAGTSTSLQVQRHLTMDSRS
ncbi:choice-of-anchor R domain-containing protein [Paludibacterium sp. B53371]|uniref:choice-of-anchor R domain-containing protein n=1 Tax=Paludibacterium sp. B53371 TaxID=2806263 RepID=UPI001C03DD2A|nr:choice-of-anchor R domain-containing protein [Paludibacterium sp. B53371]